LIFEKFDACDQARLALRDGGFVQFGGETGPVRLPNYGAFRFTRIAGATPDAPDIYSPVQAGWVSPPQVQNTELPAWSALAAPSGSAYAKAAQYGEQIRAELRNDKSDLLVLEREFQTQSVDPMFLEPECGLAWYDTGRGALELILGVQSTCEAAEASAYLLGQARTPFKPKRIDAQFAYMGGAFGGRDHTPFPLYVALAAMFFPGRPVRLAHDRYGQFQGGIKRHRFDMHTRIGVDRTTGRIQAFAADHVLDGGGLANYSASVATVAATAAIGIYDIPKVDVTTVALHTRGVTAGSMRGFGTLQTMTALEVLIDELAHTLPLDPIELRRRNALKPGGRTMTGNPYIVSVRTAEILDKLEKHPIWLQRADEKARAHEAGRLAGTGVACVTKDYGTGADCSLGRVEIDPDGRIAIDCDHVEMGTAVGHGAREPGGGFAGRRGGRSFACPHRYLRRACSRHLRRSLHDDASGPGCGAAQSRLGPDAEYSHHCLHRRSRWNPCRGGPRPASFSGLDYGLLRSTSGASCRRMPRHDNGSRRNGRMGTCFCPAWRRFHCPRSRKGRTCAISSPARWRTRSRAGPGRRRASWLRDTHGPPRSMRSP
jgi:hypothetical protein